MIGKLWKNNSILGTVLIKNFEMTITDNSAKRLIQCPLMLNISEAIHKNKITITVDNRCTLNAKLFLKLLLGLDHKNSQIPTNTNSEFAWYHFSLIHYLLCEGILTSSHLLASNILYFNTICRTLLHIRQQHLEFYQ